MPDDEPTTPTEGHVEASAGDAGAQAGQVAALILDATERATARIMDATVATAKAITDALTAVPTALATPPPVYNGATPEDIADIVRRYGNDYGGPDIAYDPAIDYLVNERGESIAPNWQEPGGDEAVNVPDPTREMFDTVAPGANIVPGVPRLDIPPTAGDYGSNP